MQNALKAAIRVLYNILLQSTLNIFSGTHWCDRGQIPSISLVRIPKIFFSVYWFCEPSKEEKWKTTFDSIYFFNHQRRQRMHLEQWGLRLMCICHFCALEQVKRNPVLTVKGSKTCRTPFQPCHGGIGPRPLSHFLIRMDKTNDDKCSQWAGVP